MPTAFDLSRHVAPVTAGAFGDPKVVDDAMCSSTSSGRGRLTR